LDRELQVFPDGGNMNEDNYGHTSPHRAFNLMDVYGIGPDEARASRRKVRLGMIGAGGVAQSKYLPAINRLRTIWEPVEVVAFAEPRELQARKVESIYGARWYSDFRKMLKEEELDGIMVFSPDELHAEHTAASLESGRPVLVEKPICRSLVEAGRMCQTARENSLALMTVAMKRYSPPYRRARHFVDSGPLLNPALYAAKFNLGYDYVDLLESGTIHLFDLTRYFMGDVRRVHTVAVNKYGRNRRPYPFDNAAVNLEFRSGAIGTIYTSATALSFKPWERVEIYADHAWLSIEDQCELLLYDNETGPAKSWKPVITNTLLFDEEFIGYMGMIENFLQVIRGHETALVTGDDGRKAFELAVACHLSLARREPIHLPLEAASADAELQDWLKERR
jgi:predicted dehydrogenase